MRAIFRSALMAPRARRLALDLEAAARAARAGAVDLLLVDINETIPDTVDADDGAVSRAARADASTHDVIDEIAGRAILSGAGVLGVRRADMPDGAPLAAILRYPI